jgi:ribose 5-phosphate isomerase B
MTKPAVALVADHAGFELKNLLRDVLEGQGYGPLDLGTHSAESVDYPDMAGRLTAAMREGRAERGVMVCGTGIGISIAANRRPWIRAAVCHDATSARLAREHNDANVLALGARLVGTEVARDCLLTFLTTAFAGGRHGRRVAKLNQVPEAAPMSDRSPEVAV